MALLEQSVGPGELSLKKAGGRKFRLLILFEDCVGSNYSLTSSEDIYALIILFWFCVFCLYAHFICVLWNCHFCL